MKFFWVTINERDTDRSVAFLGSAATSTEAAKFVYVLDPDGPRVQFEQKN